MAESSSTSKYTGELPARKFYQGETTTSFMLVHQTALLYDVNKPITIRAKDISKEYFDAHVEVMPPELKGDGTIKDWSSTPARNYAPMVYPPDSHLTTNTRTYGFDTNDEMTKIESQLQHFYRRKPLATPISPDSVYAAILQQVRCERSYTAEMLRRQSAFHVLTNPHVFGSLVDKELRTTGESYLSLATNLFTGRTYYHPVAVNAVVSMWNLPIDQVSTVGGRIKHHHDVKVPPVVLISNGLFKHDELIWMPSHFNASELINPPLNFMLPGVREERRLFEPLNLRSKQLGQEHAAIWAETFNRENMVHRYCRTTESLISFNKELEKLTAEFKKLQFGHEIIRKGMLAMNVDVDELDTQLRESRLPEIFRNVIEVALPVESDDEEEVVVIEDSGKEHASTTEQDVEVMEVGESEDSTSVDVQIQERPTVPSDDKPTKEAEQVEVEISEVQIDKDSERRLSADVEFIPTLDVISDQPQQPQHIPPPKRQDVLNMPAHMAGCMSPVALQTLHKSGVSVKYGGQLADVPRLGLEQDDTLLPSSQPLQPQISPLAASPEKRTEAVSIAANVTTVTADVHASNIQNRPKKKATIKTKLGTAGVSKKSAPSTALSKPHTVSTPPLPSLDITSETKYEQTGTVSVTPVTGFTIGSSVTNKGFSYKVPALPSTSTGTEQVLPPGTTIHVIPTGSIAQQDEIAAGTSSTVSTGDDTEVVVVSDTDTGEAPTAPDVQPSRSSTMVGIGAKSKLSRLDRSTCDPVPEHLRDKERHYCDTCDKSFKNAKHRNYHMKNICGKKEGEKMYKCRYEDCDKDFHSIISKREHHALDHMKEKPYKCPLCDERFPRSKGYSDHKKEAHPNVKVPNFVWPKKYD